MASIISNIKNLNNGILPKSDFLAEYNYLFERYKHWTFKKYQGFSLDFDVSTNTLNIWWEGHQVPPIDLQDEYAASQSHFLYIPIEVEIFNFIRHKYNIPQDTYLTVNIGNYKKYFDNEWYDTLVRYKIVVLLVGDINYDGRTPEIKEVKNIKFNFPDTWLTREFYNKNIKTNQFLDRTYRCFSQNYTTTFKLIIDSNIRFENCYFLYSGYDQITFGVDMSKYLYLMKQYYKVWALEYDCLIPITEESNYAAQSLVTGNNVMGSSGSRADTLLDMLFKFDLPESIGCIINEKEVLELINNNPVLRKLAVSNTSNRLFLYSNLIGLIQVVKWYSEDKFSGIKRLF